MLNKLSLITLIFITSSFLSKSAHANECIKGEDITSLYQAFKEKTLHFCKTCFQKKPSVFEPTKSRKASEKPLKFNLNMFPDQILNIESDEMKEQFADITLDDLMSYTYRFENYFDKLAQFYIETKIFRLVEKAIYKEILDRQSSKQSFDCINFPDHFTLPSTKLKPRLCPRLSSSSRIDSENSLQTLGSPHENYFLSGLGASPYQYLLTQFKSLFGNPDEIGLSDIAFSPYCPNDVESEKDHVTQYLNFSKTFLEDILKSLRSIPSVEDAFQKHKEYELSNYLNLALRTSPNVKYFQAVKTTSMWFQKQLSESTISKQLWAEMMEKLLNQVRVPDELNQHEKDKISFLFFVLNQPFIDDM